MRIGVAVGCVGTRGEGAVSSGGIVCVADGGGTEWKDCCRFSDWISGELREDLPYRLPFTLNISEVCTLAWKGEVVKVIEALVDQCVGRSVGGSKG